MKREMIVKQQVSMTVYGKNRKSTAKQVVCIDDGKRYASCADAADEINVHPTSISHCCRGKIKTVKGKRYKYAEENGKCTDMLADSLQEKIKLLEKYSDVIAEMERKEIRQKELETLLEHAKTDLDKYQEKANNARFRISQIELELHNLSA